VQKQGTFLAMTTCPLSLPEEEYPMAQYNWTPQGINSLSAYTSGKPGKLPTPAVVKHRMPHNRRLRRRRRDTGQVLSTCSLENSHG